MTSCKKGLAKTAAGMTWTLVALACLLIAAAAFGQDQAKGGKGGGKGGGGGRGEPPADPAIAYHVFEELNVMNADGSNRTGLGLSGLGLSDDYFPIRGLSWSPDGGSIAIAFNSGGLFVVDVSVVDGVPTAGNLTQLLDFDIDGVRLLRDVAWSPVSDEIAINGFIEVDGSTTEAILVVPRNRVPGDPLPEPLITGPSSTVTWRWDGTQIAFVAPAALPDGSGGNESVVYVLDLASGVVRDILHGGGVISFVNLDWARTNDEIALAHTKVPSIGLFPVHIGIVDIATGELITLILDARHPSWSPDDKKLAFHDDKNPGKGLAVYDFETGKVTNFKEKVHHAILDWRRNP